VGVNFGRAVAGVQQVAQQLNRSVPMENSGYLSSLEVRIAMRGVACPGVGGHCIIILIASNNADVRVIMTNGLADSQPCFMDSQHCRPGKSQIRTWRIMAAKQMLLPRTHGNGECRDSDGSEKT